MMVKHGEGLEGVSPALLALMARIAART